MPGAYEVAQHMARVREMQQAQVDAALRHLYEAITRKLPADGGFDCVFLERWRCMAGEAGLLQEFAESAQRLRTLRPEQALVLRKTSGGLSLDFSPDAGVPDQGSKTTRRD